MRLRNQLHHKARCAEAGALHAWRRGDVFGALLFGMLARFCEVVDDHATA